MAQEPRDKHQHRSESGEPSKKHGSTAEQTAALNETFKAFAKQYYEDNEQNTRRERIKFRIEIGVAIGVALNIALTGGLLVAGAIQARYSGQQVKTSQDQLAVMQDTEKRQLRAYVGILPVTGIQNFGNHDTQEVVISRKNYGLYSSL
jgi:hypothetical protein